MQAFLLILHLFFALFFSLNPLISFLIRLSPFFSKLYLWVYIQEHPQETKRLLGLEHQQLLELMAYGKLLKENQQKEVEKGKVRLIKEGGGNKAKLSEEEQIILMLVYLRHYLSFQLLGIMFKISESSAHIAEFT